MPNRNTVFDWHIDAENYISNGHKSADKLSTKNFIKKICHELDGHKNKAWADIMGLPNTHVCTDLGRKKSKEAKSLNAKLEQINYQMGNQGADSTQIQPFQIAIKSIADRRQFRVFGYILNGTFYLVYLDPEHSVYKS